MSTEPSTPPLDLLKHLPTATAHGVRFLDAMLYSADVDTIGAKRWWTRARTALETGASGGMNLSEVIAGTAESLEISGALDTRTDKELAPLIVALSDEDAFAECMEVWEREAVSIAAVTRMIREARKPAKTTKATKATKAAKDSEAARPSPDTTQEAPLW